MQPAVASPLYDESCKCNNNKYKNFFFPSFNVKLNLKSKFARLSQIILAYQVQVDPSPTFSDEKCKLQGSIYTCAYTVDAPGTQQK